MNQNCDNFRLFNYRMFRDRKFKLSSDRYVRDKIISDSLQKFPFNLSVKYVGDEAEMI